MIVLSMEIPLAKLAVVSKKSPPTRIVHLLSSSSSFSKPSAVLSERITTKPAPSHVYTSGVVHLLLR